MLVGRWLLGMLVGGGWWLGGFELGDGLLGLALGLGCLVCWLLVGLFV
jgi:hypothetical protein